MINYGNFYVFVKPIKSILDRYFRVEKFGVVLDQSRISAAG